jgi:hypothetical protein
MNPLKRCLPSKKDEVIGAQNINEAIPILIKTISI